MGFLVQKFHVRNSVKLEVRDWDERAGVVVRNPVVREEFGYGPGQRLKTGVRDHGLR